MELDINTPNIRRSKELTESFFGVADLSIIFEILRNKMYSDPVKAICREVTSNARDAHREIGKFDEPIEIYIPNVLSPSLKIKDFGPGISPDRMSNVFINYAASTKRDDNIQTGGFGLGAKTPFSYSDSFTIITSVDGIKYNYSCYIDETKVGKLVKLSEEKTNDLNGTEIIVPVKRKDFNAFSKAIVEYTRYWDVKPRIIGLSTYDQEDVDSETLVVSGSFWKIYNTKADYSSKIIALVDGIPYPINSSYFRANKTIQELDRSYYLTTLINFNVGELSLSANREQIYIEESEDDKSYSAILLKLNKIYEELKVCVENQIKTYSNFIDAALFFKSVSKEINLYKNINPLWNNLTLDVYKSYDGVRCLSFRHMLNNVEDLTSRDISSAFFSKNPSSTLDKEKERLFVYDYGTKAINKTHALKIFKANKNIKQIIFIQIKDKDIYAETIKELQARYDGEDFSKYYNRRGAPNKSKTNNVNPVNLYTLNGFGFGVSSKKIFKKCTGKKIFLKIDSNSKLPIINGKQFSVQTVRSIIHHFNHDALNESDKYIIFAVKNSVNDIKIKKFLDDSAPIEELTEEYLKGFYDDDLFALTKYFYKNEINYRGGYDNYHPYIFDELNKKSLREASKLINNYYESKELINKIDDIYNLLELYEAVNGEISDEKAYSAYKNNKSILDSYSITNIYKRYPMLEIINASKNNTLQLVLDYIVLIEKEKKKEKQHDK